MQIIAFKKKKKARQVEMFLVMINESPADEWGNTNGGLNHPASESDMGESAFAWWRCLCATIKYSQVDSSVERCGGSVRFSVQSCSCHVANAHLRGGYSVASPCLCLTWIKYWYLEI